jgi:hypothetical protein
MRLKKLCLIVILIAIFGFVSMSFSALIGISPNLPLITFDSGGTTTYNACTDLLSIESSPTAIRLSSADPPRFINPTGDPQSEVVSIEVEVNDAGELVGGVAGDDLLVVGEVDLDGDGGVDHSGVLLTGEVLEFGFEDTGTTTDEYDFRFTVTGGELAFLYDGKDLGVTVTSESSSFTGDFTKDFDGYAKGNIGAIPWLCAGSIGDYVWLDVNRDGIQDPDETGVNGVEVKLDDGMGTVMTVTTFTGGPADQPGYYEFERLCAGDYTILINADTVPSGYEPTKIGAAGSTPENDSNDPAGTTVTLPTDDTSDQTIDFGFTPPECGECEGKVTQLTLQYNGAEAAFIEVVQKKPCDTVFSGMVQPGEQFTFSGTDKKGTLGTEIRIYVDDMLNTKIHTSCSKPIGPGLVSGDFEVIEGYSRKGGLLCPIEPCGEDSDSDSDSGHDSDSGCDSDSDG